jgi:hypothetical protein
LSETMGWSGSFWKYISRRQYLRDHFALERHWGRRPRLLSLLKNNVIWLPIIFQNPFKKHDVIWLTNYSNGWWKERLDPSKELVLYSIDLGVQFQDSLQNLRASPRVCQNLLGKSCVLPTSKKLCKVKKEFTSNSLA